MKIIIPSGNRENLNSCLSNLFSMHDNLENEHIIIVDDSGQGKVDFPVDVIEGERPFIFSRNVNVGLNFAIDEQMGALIISDDVEVKTFNGLYKLRDTAIKGNVGILSPGVDGECGNTKQRFCGREGVVTEDNMLCFICVYISVEVLNTVGYMDERFVGYGFEDNDYSKQAINAGFRLGVTDDVLVEHKGKSVWRQKDVGDLFDVNMKLYKEKWG